MYCSTIQTESPAKPIKRAQAVFHLWLVFVLLLWASSMAVAQTIEDYIDDRWPDSRYTVHDNGTVTDTTTGLMWMRCARGQSGADCATGSAGTFTWDAALAQPQVANQAQFAGYSDWRLPNIKDLGSLVALNRFDPAVNSTAFPNTKAGAFWAASPYSHLNSYGAWTVIFTQGSDAAHDVNFELHVRLVRGGR